MALQMEPGHRYFTERITNGYISSVFTVTITDGIYPLVFDREF